MPVVHPVGGGIEPQVQQVGRGPVIILSGILVVLAIALLVAGIVAGADGVGGVQGLTLIYVSIAISIVSAFCLAIGVFLRRKEIFGVAGAAPARAGKPVKIGKPGKAARQTRGAKEDAAQVPEEAVDEAVAFPSQPLDVPADAMVFVVRGRKRYHLDNCRQLTGRDKEDLTYGEALEEGFSPCTACMPDTALAARAATWASTPSGIAPDDPFGADRPGSGGFGSSQWESRPATPISPESTTGDDESPALAPRPVRMTSPIAPSALDLPAEPITAPVMLEFPAAEPKSAGPRTTDPDPDPDPDPGPVAQDEDGVREDPLGWSSDPLGVDPFGADPFGADPLGADPLVVDPLGAGPLVVDPPEHPVPAEEPDAVFAAGEPAAGPERVADGTAGPQVRILSGTRRYHRPDCALIEDIGDEAEDLESLSRVKAKERGCTPCLVCQPDKEHAGD
jgi:hypothetical protein